MVQTRYRTAVIEGNRPLGYESHRTAIEGVVQYMRAHVGEQLTLDDLADQACLSPYYFCRVFHWLVGLPPGEFLASLRLQAAKQLLLTTSLSVTEVCFEVGYSGLGSFTTRFSQLIGVPPRLLRNLSQESLHMGKLPSSAPRRSPTPSTASNSILTGEIALPTAFTGIIFAGLFPKPIPQGHPVRCTALHAPGSYCIAGIPDGRYYLMVAAFPLSENPQTYLLPAQSLMVGIYGPIFIQHNTIAEPVNLLLRPLRPTDPPILSALPFL